MNAWPRQKKDFFLITMIIFIGVTPLFGQDFIEESFSVHPGYFYLIDFDTFGKDVNPDNEPRPQEARIPKEVEDKVYLYLLNEAAWILSGKIFGFHFEYQPSDRKRNITEKFILTPIASIPIGNKRLQVLETGYSENREEIFIRIRYYYSKAEKRRINLWNSTTFPASGGLGSVPINSENSNMLAMKEGIKEAIRNHIRPLVRNRPGKITGIVALREPPTIHYTVGKCLSRVSISLRYDSVEHDSFSHDVEQ